MWLRAGSVVVWALVAGSAVFWGLRLFTAAPGMPAGTQPATSVASAQADLTRLLGADPVAAEPVAAAADARFHLLGVVSPRAGAPAEA
ncbi:MAG: general secretion pathway protein C, partial [Burkholderiales bacterium]|nr:general secretion pathway protein C [Burkholderiales bacterium]